MRADGPEDPSTDQNADRSRGYERTNTNSAFYPFRGGKTRLAAATARSESRYQRTPPVTLAPRLALHNHCLESAKNILVQAEKDLAGLREALGLYATRPGAGGCCLWLGQLGGAGSANASLSSLVSGGRLSLTTTSASAWSRASAMRGERCTPPAP